MSVTPSQFDVLAKSLNASGLRHKVISQNIANVNTPGFRAQHVSFEENLKKTLSMGGSELGAVEPRVAETEGLTSRVDGNNVDIDREVAELNKNTLMYETYTQLLITQLSVMRSAITGR